MASLSVTGQGAFDNDVMDIIVFALLLKNLSTAAIREVDGIILYICNDIQNLGQ